MTSVLKVDNIQNSSGTSAISIDSSGRVTTPARPYASAAWDGTSIASDGKFTGYETSDHNLQSGLVKIIYENDGNMLNTSTGIITVPVTGVYLIVGHYVNNNSTTARRIGHLYVNGTFYGEWQESYGQYDDQSAVKMLKLTANDTVQFGRNTGLPYADFGFEMTLLG